MRGITIKERLTSAFSTGSTIKEGLTSAFSTDNGWVKYHNNDNFEKEAEDLLIREEGLFRDDEEEDGIDELRRILAYIAENPTTSLIQNDDGECIETEAYFCVV